MVLAHLLIVTLGRVLSVTAGRDRSRDSGQTHPAGGDARHHFGLGSLAVVGLLIALPLLAHVAPVDQIVMRGIFDQGDGDDVIDRITERVLARGDVRAIDLPLLWVLVGDVVPRRGSGTQREVLGLSQDRAPPVADPTELVSLHASRLSPPCSAPVTGVACQVES